MCLTLVNSGSAFLLMFCLRSPLNVLQIVWIPVCEGNSSDDSFVSLASIRHSILDIMIYCEVLFNKILLW